MILLQGFIKFDQGISEKRAGQKLMSTVGVDTVVPTFYIVVGTNTLPKHSMLSNQVAWM
jgi:hypothetical protein